MENNVHPVTDSTHPVVAVPPSESRALSAGTPLIELLDVSVATKAPAQTAILEGVQWRIEAGQWWVVGGPPGSGRTQLLLTAAGMHRPLAGTHRLLGQDLAMLDDAGQLELRRRVGLVFEGGVRLFYNLNVAQNVALPYCYHHNATAPEAESLVSSWLEYLELDGVAGSFPSQLTPALRQRVVLARALILKPDVLLLDNPLGALDARQARWWLDRLRTLAMGQNPLLERPLTLVVVTGNLGPWRDYGRQFALLKQKRWVFLGGRAELAASEEPLLKDLLAGEYVAG